MTDIIVLLIILILVVLAVSYLVKEQKKGTKCLGCPMAATCAKNKKTCK